MLKKQSRRQYGELCAEEGKEKLDEMKVTLVDEEAGGLRFVSREKVCLESEIRKP